MKKKTYKMYMCSIVADWEIGDTDVTLYSSLDDLKRKHKCWKDCGVTEVTVQVKKEIVKANKYE